MNLFDSLDLFDDPEAKSAALNMAVDEAFLETTERPAFRVYRWRSPSISFGYFSRFSDVAEFETTYELVRRWTGGGIVFHETDLTYSVFIPVSDPFFARSSSEIYSALHERIVEVLQEHGIAAGLTTVSVPKISDNCFANPVRADIVSGEKKIAGAAHRRTRRGLLHQGSIQLPDLSATSAQEFAEKLCSNYRPNDLSKPILERATQLAQEKYATDHWLRRRL